MNVKFFMALSVESYDTRLDFDRYVCKGALEATTAREHEVDGGGWTATVRIWGDLYNDGDAGDDASAHEEHGYPVEVFSVAMGQEKPASLFDVFDAAAEDPAIGLQVVTIDDRPYSESVEDQDVATSVAINSGTEAAPALDAAEAEPEFTDDDL